VLLFEIIFWFNFGIAVFENIQKAGNNLLDFVLGELGADPDDEAGYSRHRACLQVVSKLHSTPCHWGEASPF